MIHRQVQLALCAMLMLIGGVGVAGWTFDIEAMKSVIPGLSTMKINTALCFFVVGAALAAAGFERAKVRRSAAVGGGIVALAGAATMVEYAAGVSLGIDEMFVRDTGTLTGSGVPGRMSPLTATAWMALGPALIALAIGTRRRTIIGAHLLAVYAGFIAFLAAAGYAFGAEAFWGIGFYTAMAIHTAVGLLIAAVAVLLTRPDDGWLAGFADSPDSRALLVHLLPLSLILPTGLGFLLLFGSGIGAFNAAFGFALFVPCTALAMALLALEVAGRARRGELGLRAGEAALRASEERLSTALAIARLGTFEWDLPTDRLRLDARSLELFGFGPGEGTHVEEAFDRIDPADLQRLLAEVRASRDAMARLETEFRVILPDGTTRTLINLSDVDGNGTAERFFGVFGDISERKRLEEDLRRLNETLEERVRERSAELERVHEQLRQSQKLEAMGQLTGGVAHDFNNLLSPIIGSLDLIQRRGFDGARSQRLIDGALASAERAKMLVQRLLAFARRQPLQASAVDLGGLLDGMADLVASTSGPRIKLVIDVEEQLPPAKADSNQLEMALLNLAVNARDAMPDGGTLTISAKAEALDGAASSRLAPGAYVRLSVADTGVGMDEETMLRAIEPFFSTKGVGRGTGLGLSMVHGLAAQLGGDLQLRSKRGLGTIVDLWLPVFKGESEAPAVPADGEHRVASGTALLVDDEESVRVSTAEMLTDLGYDVVEASSAEEALELVEQGLQPDVVITDHLMPGMTGADLARALRERRLPVLIISGYSDVDEIAPDLQRLSKPFRQADIAVALAALTGGTR
ncbi:hybrid sensor histidine kinase/response regulator [Sphingomonas sp.]|uniref:hybrid sensor histidine kinase/response regulator n=1 Tax=Sphingomonas sp. TaxID=28214 RepID=UPI002FCA55EA